VETCEIKEDESNLNRREATNETTNAVGNVSCVFQIAGTRSRFQSPFVGWESNVNTASVMEVIAGQLVAGLFRSIRLELKQMINRALYGEENIPEFYCIS